MRQAHIGMTNGLEEQAVQMNNLSEQIQHTHVLQEFWWVQIALLYNEMSLKGLCHSCKCELASIIKTHVVNDKVKLV